MLAKTICAAAVAASIGVAVPAVAGEGSPDINLGPYGNYGNGPSYPYVVEPDVMLTVPAYPPVVADSYIYEPDYNVGYVPRRSRIERNRAYDSRGFNSF